MRHKSHWVGLITITEAAIFEIGDGNEEGLKEFANLIRGLTTFGYGFEYAPELSWFVDGYIYDKKATDEAIF